MLLMCGSNPHRINYNKLGDADRKAQALVPVCCFVNKAIIRKADETGLTGLDRMVNEHFRRTHRRETNYSITHFAKSDYLLQLAQGIIEY